MQGDPNDLSPDRGAATNSEACRPDECESFLRLLWGDCEDDACELPAALVITDVWAGRSFWARRIPDAVQVAAQLARLGRDVYFHVALHDLQRRQEQGGGQVVGHLLGQVVATFRGLAITAVVLVGLWIDIDFGVDGHAKKNLPPTREAAMRVVAAIEEALGFPLSVVVDSGGGLHAYLLFREPWRLDSDADRARAQRLVAGFQRLSGIIAGRLGEELSGVPWEHDATHDLPRVLRVPGTSNWKLGSPRPVRVIAQSGTRVNPTELEEHPAIAPLLGPTSAGLGAAHAKTRAPDSEEMAHVREKLDLDLRSYRGFRRTWNHEVDAEIAANQRRGGRAVDTSDSVYDFRIAYYAARLGWTEQETRGLLDEHYRSRGRDPRAKSEQYYSRTIGKARRNALGDPIPDAPLPPKATRSVIRSASDLYVVREVAESWVPGEQSVVVCGWPGIGKTTQFGEASIRSLGARAKGWESGVALLVLPTRELVNEKTRKLHAIADDNDVAIRTLMGRQGDPRKKWYCAVLPDYRFRSELGRQSCRGCLSATNCSMIKGGFLNGVTGVSFAIDEAVAGGPSVLILVTRDMLPNWIHHFPADAPIIMDDAGALFGLVHDHAYRQEDLVTALDSVSQWLESDAPNADPGHPTIQVAEVTKCVLGAMRGLHRSGAVKALVDSIQGLPAAESLMAQGKDAFWPWEVVRKEDGEDLRPAFTSFALDVAQAVQAGLPPVMYRTDRRARSRGEPEQHVLLRDRKLIDRARRGFVAWLGVGPMPEDVCAALNVRQEVLLAEPDHLRAVVALVPSESSESGTSYLSFGPAVDDDPPRADEIARALWRSLGERLDSGPVVAQDVACDRLGGVLHKADFAALKKPRRLGYYGKDHAGTDRLADVDLLLVRRFQPPFEVIRRDARALAQALGIPTPEEPQPAKGRRKRGELPDGLCLETRRWEGDDQEFVTVALVNRLERDVLRFHELHNQLNAVGRCRPLTAPSPRVVVLLAGRPFDWVRPKVVLLADLVREWGIELDLPDPEARAKNFEARNAAQQADAQDRREALRELVEGDRSRSQRALAVRLGVSVGCVNSDLRAIGAGPLSGGHFVHSSAIRILWHWSEQTVPWPGLGEVLAEIRERDADPPGERTVKRRLAEIRAALEAGSTVIVPKRSDHARSLQTVLEALQRLLDRLDGDGEEVL